jgi:RNA polymerase sigma-70 factor (ECF subfamily)
MASQIASTIEGDTVLPADEQGLLIACQQGDMHAYARLVHLYQDTALRTAFLMTNDRQAAEDIAQNAFLNALRNIHRFDIERPFRPWFLTILTNEARMYLRGQRRHALEELDPRMPENGASLVTHVIQNDERARIRYALSQLDEPFRTAAVLYYFNDLTIDEVADATGCRPGTVKSRLFTARQRLRDFLAWPTVAGQSNTPREEWMVLGDSTG